MSAQTKYRYVLANMASSTEMTEEQAAKSNASFAGEGMEYRWIRCSEQAKDRESFGADMAGKEKL